MFDMAQFVDSYADVEDLQEWAKGVILSREPDFIIGDDYMRRWFIIPRNEKQNVYLHVLRQSDEPVMHDHPWDSTSLIIKNGFVEHTPEGSFTRKPGDLVTRKATDLHWLEVLPGQYSISLFFTGAKIRDWGFQCPNGWVSWQQYTGGKRDGRSVRSNGCGEEA